MIYESKRRSVAKGLSWRTLATLTTTGFVYVFTGEVGLALTVGFFEAFVKIAIYVAHERLWQRVRWGKKEVKAVVVWLTGLSGCGKGAIAEAVAAQLRARQLKVDRIDGQQVREILPETGFAREQVDMHIKRVGLLASRLEKNGVIVVASFVSPYRESRDFVRGQARRFVEVHVDATVDYCMQRDTKDLYRRAQAGEIDNLPGVNAPYEPPARPEIVIDAERVSVDEAAHNIVSYLEKNILYT